MKALMWIHEEADRVSVREAGPFTPKERIVEIDFEPGVTTNEQACQLTANAYRQKGLPVPSALCQPGKE